MYLRLRVCLRRAHVQLFRDGLRQRGLGFGVSWFQFRVPGFGFRVLVPGSEIRVPDTVFGFRDFGFMSRPANVQLFRGDSHQGGVRFRVSGFGFGFGVQFGVSCLRRAHIQGLRSRFAAKGGGGCGFGLKSFWFQDSGFGIRDSDSGFGFRNGYLDGHTSNCSASGSNHGRGWEYDVRG